MLHLHHSSFSNTFVSLPTSQLIPQPFRCFFYVTAHSPTLSLLHLRHNSFSNPSLASPTSQALHLRHVVTHESRRQRLEEINLSQIKLGQCIRREKGCAVCRTLNKELKALRILPDNKSTFQNAQWQKPIFQQLISRVLFKIETKSQEFCIALGPVTICITINNIGLLYLFFNTG